MCKSLLPKRHLFINYIVPFYKEKFVSYDQLASWFRQYNYFHMRCTGRKKLENFVNACYSPDEPASGVTLVASGGQAVYLKYFRWLNVQHRLIIELGRSTKNGWYFDEQVEQKTYEHITESRLKSVCATFKNQKIELYDLFNHGQNFKEAPRLTFINSIVVQEYRPPYVRLNLSCSGSLQVVNLMFKLSELLECPISLVDADRYEVEGYSREHCLSKTDIYWDYIMESRSKHHQNLLELLKEQMHHEQLFGPTYKRYLLYR